MMWMSSITLADTCLYSYIYIYICIGICIYMSTTCDSTRLLSASFRGFREIVCLWKYYPCHNFLDWLSLEFQNKVSALYATQLLNKSYVLVLRLCALRYTLLIGTHSWQPHCVQKCENLVRACMSEALTILARLKVACVRVCVCRWHAFLVY